MPMLYCWVANNQYQHLYQSSQERRVRQKAAIVADDAEAKRRCRNNQADDSDQVEPHSVSPLYLQPDPSPSALSQTLTSDAASRRRESGQSHPHRVVEQDQSNAVVVDPGSAFHANFSEDRFCYGEQGQAHGEAVVLAATLLESEGEKEALFGAIEHHFNEAGQKQSTSVVPPIPITSNLRRRNPQLAPAKPGTRHQAPGTRHQTPSVERESKEASSSTAGFPLIVTTSLSHTVDVVQRCALGMRPFPLLLPSTEPSELLRHSPPEDPGREPSTDPMMGFRLSALEQFSPSKDPLPSRFPDPRIPFLNIFTQGFLSFTAERSAVALVKAEGERRERPGCKNGGAIIQGLLLNAGPGRDSDPDHDTWRASTLFVLAELAVKMLSGRCYETCDSVRRFAHLEVLTLEGDHNDLRFATLTDFRPPPRRVDIETSVNPNDLQMASNLIEGMSLCDYHAGFAQVQLLELPAGVQQRSLVIAMSVQYLAFTSDSCAMGAQGPSTSDKRD
ncbi:hypothetical protein BDK51DRAFT_51557 [Blyttiomyces helicus]|uniref:Uncharacterized protein n=1 Tax=Blyttiomyces helicus TaxID=388810 RepID=A0A4V1IRF5_9FUNG|nr:hypothetical protein BDK51DRAFT_51557 [Blyttiomyces helicus]|eukprot:RKO89877.1 hypothetical protein BDK51DRAFT_51557 [Blyttiomyces helicus]